MRATYVRWFALLAGLALFALTAPSASAQVMGMTGSAMPLMMPPPLAGGAALLGTPYGSSAASLTSPYGLGGANSYGMSPYGYYTIPDLAGGYLRGIADVTTANAKYQVTIQQARIAQVQADNAKLDLRRRISDEARYERMRMANPEQVRLAERTATLDQARHDPPANEVWSGRALNALLGHAADQFGKGIRGPNVPLDADQLKGINVTTGTGGSVGILKDEGKLLWPLSLDGADFAEARKRVSRDLPEVVRQVKFNNPVDAATLKDLRADLRRLNEALARNAENLSPSQYIEARRYLSYLDDAFKALQDPNVAHYFTRKWNAQGKTVAELVKHMSDEGLRFAPATPGDEAAYQALHRALTSYDAGLGQLTAGPK
jgi:hypothetical protein